MVRNDSFYVQKIEDSSYLIPTGQMVADMMCGVKINSTGEYVWQQLVNDLTNEEVINGVIRNFGIPDEEKEEISEDINAFLDNLFRLGMIYEKEMKPREEEHIKNIRIAGINIAFYGDSACYPKGFEDFESCINEREDLRIELSHKFSLTRNGKVLVRNSTLCVMELENSYILSFPQTEQIRECELKKDGSLARFVLVSNMDDENKKILFHAIRAVFLYKALDRNLVAVHSASILYNGKALLFSAAAGTGKSTQAGYWTELFGAHNINGDLNLVGEDNGVAKVFGIPWCGTSGIKDINEYELGGIVFLKRSLENCVERLTDENKILMMQQRIISPSWKKEQTEKIFITVEEISKKIKMYKLFCTKSSQSAHVLKEYLDRNSKEG